MGLYPPVKKSKKLDKNSIKPVRLMVPGRAPRQLPAGEALQFLQQLAGQQQWGLISTLAEQITTQIPGLEEAWLSWFDACHRLGDGVRLEAIAQRCLEHKPRSVPALVALATALRLQQRQEEACDYLTKAVKLDPANAAVLNHLGIVQKELGAPAALDTFNRCIALQPDLTDVYWNRSDLLRQPAPQQLDAMLQLLRKPNLSASQQARLHYALSRAYEFLGDWEKQIHHVLAGARCKRDALSYNHATEMQQMAAIPQFFTATILQQADALEHQSCTPVFICGLPRSGSTLAEQILSSHPEVMAGDELTALPLATANVLRALHIDKAFPHWAGDLQMADWRTIGQLYRNQTAGLQQKRFFTDKNLQNYKALGLIHLALPDAKIIYCRRNAMDTLWGCYRQLFGDGLPFTYDQRELADTWNAAERVMEYWQQQLPDKIFVLDYESLIHEQERVTRQLLEFVGLDWNDACLRFYENPRAVKTVSAVQVRSPLNPGRIGQWQRFAPWLQEMKSALQRPTE